MHFVKSFFITNIKGEVKLPMWEQLMIGVFDQGLVS